MEGTQILLLLEEIFTGKIQNSIEFEKKTNQLHSLLSISKPPLLKAASIISKRLKDKKILSNENFEIFQNYIKTAISGKQNLDLPLKNTGYSDEIAKKTSKLVFGVNHLGKIIINTLRLVFISLKSKSLKKNKEKQACINFVFLVQSVFSRSKGIFWKILKKWSETRKNKRILGKFKKKLSQLNVIKKMIKTIPPTIESLAYFRWKVKVIEYKSLKENFKKAVERSDFVLKLSQKKLRLAKWKKLTKSLKKNFIEKFRKALNAGNSKFFYCKKIYFISWKAFTYAKPNNKKITKENYLQKETKKKEKNKFLNVLQVACLRYHYLKKLVFFKIFECGYIEPDNTKTKHDKINEKKIILNPRFQKLNCKKINEYKESFNKNSKVFTQVLRNANLRLFFCLVCCFKIWKNIQTKEVSTIKKEKGSGLLSILSKILKKYKKLIFLSIKICSKSRHSDLSRIFSKISSRILRHSLFLLLKQAPQKIFLVLNQILSAQKKTVIKILKRAAKSSKLLKTCKKLSFVQTLSKKLAKSHKILKKKFFSSWKFESSLSSTESLKNYLIRLSLKFPVEYTTAIWRWKYNIAHNCEELYQKPTILYRRLKRIGKNYQNRLKQFSILKIVMFSKFSSTNSWNKELLAPKSHEYLRPRSKSSKDEDDSLSSLENILGNTNEKYDYYQSIRSTNISSFSKYESAPNSQTGAGEMIGLILNSVKNRRIGWVFYNLQVFTQSLEKIVHEKYKILEEVNELRFEKSSLLEDNRSLRTHNEGLISQLEKTNIDCYLLSAIIDEMKINRMAHYIKKLLENRLIYAFLMLRLPSL